MNPKQGQQQQPVAYAKNVDKETIADDIKNIINNHFSDQNVNMKVDEYVQQKSFQKRAL